MDTPADIHFEGWTFRHRPCELLRDGMHVRLQEQPLHVLEELLKTPGELVTREHLIARLWPKRIVEFDAALNAAVRRLRSTLGDEAETPRYVETVPRQGYRFIGAVRAWRESPPVVVAESPVPSPPVWRVARRAWLPGLAIALLAVIVACGIAAAWAWYTPAAQPASADNALTSEAMARAGFFMQRRRPGDLELARKEYERALSLAPNQARAWAGLASVHWLEGAEDLQPRETILPKVRDAAQRALALNPRLAEAHIRLAMYLQATGQRAASLEHRAKAIASEPDSPLVLRILAANAADDCRWDEAIALQRRAVVAEPVSLSAAQFLAELLYLSGRVDEARAQFAKVLELDPSQPNEIGAFADVLEGRYERALRTAQTWPVGEARDEVLAMSYHGLGREADANERLGSLTSSKAWAVNVRVAEVHAFRGDIDEAFRWLQNPDMNRTYNPSPVLYASPFLKPLRKDARWPQALLVAQAEPRK